MITKKQAKEFFKRLEGPEGCDFRKDEQGKLSWNCNNKGNYKHTTAVLGKMGVSVVEIEAFLEMCRGFGGYCDCEILFNAEEKVLNALSKKKGQVFVEQAEELGLKSCDLDEEVQ